MFSGVTIVPLLGTVSTSPSAASRTSASRTGERETSNRAARLASSISWPGRSSSDSISSRSRSKTWIAP